MRKPLTELTIIEADDAIKNDGIALCPEEEEHCAYQYQTVELNYDNLGKLARWPHCENCGCSLMVEWEGRL